MIMTNSSASPIDISRYIYGTTRLGDESVSLEQRLTIARAAMESGAWFHASDQYGGALSVLARAFSEAPGQIPKMIFKIEAKTIGQMRDTIQRNLDPIGADHMDIGQLCLRDRCAEDFLPGSAGYEEFSRIREDGLVRQYFMEVFPWTSPVALEALDKGCTNHLIDGFIFYFNPLQRFATNRLWQKIQEMNIPVIAMRTVCGNNVINLRDVPGAAWADYIQQRAVEVVPLFEHSGITSWAEFCTRYVYSFDVVQATVGATSRENNLAELLRLSRAGEPFPADIREELIALQMRWSEDFDQSAEAWSL